jgi:TatD DNase family protein
LYRQLALANSHQIHYSVGLHPCAVDATWKLAVDQVAGFWDSSATGSAAESVRPVALGEIGLDRFHLPKDDPARAEEIFDWQRRAFAEGLHLAKALSCPVVIHSRGAFAECVTMIDQSGVDWSKVVFHCFTEGEAEMTELIKRGGWGSFTGIITYKTAENVRAAARAQGLGRLMIETDAPYLTPMPHRGKPNEPAFLRHTAEFCAREVFRVSDEEFATVTTATARRFFGI